MSAFTSENRTQLRRWTVSVALALLLHGGIAAALLVAYKSVTAPNMHGPLITEPFMIDLAPMPVEQIPPPSEPAPAGQPAERPQPQQQIDANGASAKPIDRAKDTTEEKAATNGQESREPAEARTNMTAPNVTAPLAIAPSTDPGQQAGKGPDSEGEGGAEPRTASGGGGGAPHAAPSNGRSGTPTDASPVDAGAVDRSPMDSSPIDTRITVQPHPQSKKAAGGTAGTAQKKFVLFRPSRHLGQPARNFSAVNGAATAINALGAHVQEHATTAPGKGTSRAEATKNAVGAAATGIVGGGDANATHGVETNAIGMTVPLRSAPPGTNVGEGKTGAVALAGGAMHVGVITGHARPGISAGAIGGPAKSATGVINGTTFRPRVP